MSINIANASKTSTFQARINPEVKKEVKGILADCGLTLTEAFNAFLQQIINVGGLPFLLTKDGDKVLREQAIALLMAELKAGEDSAQSDSDWVSEDDMLSEFGADV